MAPKREKTNKQPTGQEGVRWKKTPEAIAALMDAMRKSGGNISFSCKKAGISRTVFYEWMKEDPELATASKDVEEEQIDFVESKLMQRISENDMTGIIFFLKTKGKGRGYIENQRHEIMNAPGQ